MIFILFLNQSFAQKSAETEIRNLEELEGKSWVKKDTVTSFQLFSPGLVVNRRLYRCATLQNVKMLTRLGKIDITIVKRILKR